MLRNQRTDWLTYGCLAGLVGFCSTAQAEKPDPMKEPLALIARAEKAYAKVDDYTCTLVKRETINGALGPKQVIALTARKSPFSVSMRWKEPDSMAGQQVVYVAGENDGNMRVKASGWRGWIGFVSIGVHDPRAKAASNYPITDVGIGTLIDKLAKGWKTEQKLGKTKVSVTNTTWAGRECTRVELTHPSDAGGKLLFYRNVVYFDKKNHLPIGVSSYGWPEESGGEAPLKEEFTYRDLRLNVGVEDSVFEH
jgi:hypothetical protein